MLGRLDRVVAQVAARSSCEWMIVTITPSSVIQREDQTAIGFGIATTGVHGLLKLPDERQVRLRTRHDKFLPFMWSMDRR